MIGKKFDIGKNKIGLIFQDFSHSLWELGEVSTFGANKYGEHNWFYVENGKERYFNALFRHLFKYIQGYKIDEESGLRHLAHALWNLNALFELELIDEAKNDNRG